MNSTRAWSTDLNEISPQPILLLGARGMLGSDVARELGRRELKFVALDRVGCDVADATSCAAVISRLRPSSVINCAAFTDVNGAESNPTGAMRVNAQGAKNVAQACGALGARCVYISTDYVFDGTKPDPYVESDPPNPINAYGKSKWMGEANTVHAAAGNHLIVRSSWLFGMNGKNFVATMLELARRGTSINVVNDQVGSPTYTFDLARVIVEAACSKAVGIMHATNAGACSWFEFGQKIFELSGAGKDRVKPVFARDYPSPAKRPANSRLASIRNDFDSSMPRWEDALARFLKETGIRAEQ